MGASSRGGASSVGASTTGSGVGSEIGGAMGAIGAMGEMGSSGAAGSGVGAGVDIGAATGARGVKLVSGAATGATGSGSAAAMDAAAEGGIGATPKAAAIGSAGSSATAATAATGSGSGSEPKPVNAAPKAVSNALPPTALPLPSWRIGLRAVSAIRTSQEYGPNSAFNRLSAPSCSSLNSHAPESSGTKNEKSSLKPAATEVVLSNAGTFPPSIVRMLAVRLSASPTPSLVTSTTIRSASRS